MSGFNVNSNVNINVLAAKDGHTDGTKSMGESNPIGDIAAQALNPLGQMGQMMGMLGGLMKVAGPILGGLGI